MISSGDGRETTLTVNYPNSTKTPSLN
jgi:hypothetical protein